MSKNLPGVTHTILVCNGGSCKKKGAEEVTREMRCALKMKGLHETTHTIKTYCVGSCENAPVVLLQPEDLWYKCITTDLTADFVDQKIVRGQELPEHILFRPGWEQMAPFKTIKPKTQHTFSDQEDTWVGRVWAASVYPWEHNVYPLLKELFQAHRAQVSLWVHTQPFLSDRFAVTYENGAVFIQGDKPTENLRVITMAPKESEQFAYKVNAIKIYHDKAREVRGLYMTNSKEGLFLKAEWQGPYLLEHLAKNYVYISA